ncbi:MAG: metallophosphoesterase family protein [Planctomycetes bacterium]|nr:metallophosphoesterase family protein [Planctomycetota bacterium]
MATAIISDLHSNIEALEAVLDFCDKKNVSDFICLGDVIGYGPNPIEVAKIAIDKCRGCLRGNHEEAMVTGKHRFNPYAAYAIDWTRDQIKGERETCENGKNKSVLMEWFEQRQTFSLLDRKLMVHGSIYDPVHDYVDEPENPIEAEQMIETLKRDFSGFELCFAGHNHTPFIATEMGTIIPHDRYNTYRLPKGHRAYICVGSVGQPRDRDPRSSFAILDDEEISFHRVAYDVQKTHKKVLATGMHKFLADRLLKGI